MRSYVDLSGVPTSARALLEVVFDPEDVAEWWNASNRNLGGRPRDVWHAKGGASRVKAEARRLVKITKVPRRGRSS